MNFEVWVFIYYHWLIFHIFFYIIYNRFCVVNFQQSSSLKPIYIYYIFLKHSPITKNKADQTLEYIYIYLHWGVIEIQPVLLICVQTILIKWYFKEDGMVKYLSILNCCFYWFDSHNIWRFIVFLNRLVGWRQWINILMERKVIFKKPMYGSSFVHVKIFLSHDKRCRVFFIDLPLCFLVSEPLFLFFRFHIFRCCYCSTSEKSKSTFYFS